MPIRFKHGIEVDGSVTVDGQALGSNAFNSTTIPTHTSNLTNDSGFITQTAADLRYLQGVPQETGYNVQFLTSAIEMYDQATGGDLSWVVGADDRGGVGAAGQNAFVVRYGRGSRFNSNWRSQGTEAMTIDDSGRVGFTAPIPDTRFEIRDNGFTNNRLRIYNAGGSGSHDASIELVNNDDGAGHVGGTWLARSWGWGNASLTLGGTTTGQWSGRYNISTTQKTYFENSGGVGIRVVPETTLDVAGEITGRGGDTGLIFKSRNTSATGAPDQFKIEHNFGNVSISNPRGVINFTTGLQYGGASVATQSWVQGQGYLTSAPSITSDIISAPALISELGDTSFYNHFSGTRPTDAPSDSRGAGIQLIGGAFSAGIHIADGLYYRGANGSDISLGTWYKVASEDWVRAQGYLTSLPAHNHDGVYAPVNHNHDGVYAPINHTHTFASLTAKPTTLAGYGITDAASSTHSHTNADVHAWLYKTGGNANDYTTLGIYRNYAEGGPIGGHNTILNIMQSDGRYGFQLGANTVADADGLYYRSKDANIGDIWYQVASRDWVSSQGYLTSLPSHNHDGVYAPINHTHTFASLTAKPTTLAGYGITDAASSTHTHTFASLTSKPTTLAGYGITDAASSTHTHSEYAPKASPTFTGTIRLNGETVLGNFSGNDADEWPRVYWYRDTVNNWDEGLIKASSARGFFGKSHYGIHFDDNRAFGFFSSGWRQVFGVDINQVYSAVNLVVDGTISASGYNNNNWDTAYSWGNHANAGYLTSLPSHNHDSLYLKLTGGTLSGNLSAPSFIGKLMGASTGAPDSTIWCVSGQYTDWGIFYDEGTPDKIHFKSAGTSTANIALDTGVISTTEGDSTKWSTAYNWGNHANAGYLTSYTETDTLATVVDRGQSANRALVVTAVDSGNPTAAVDSARMSGYGLLGNRGTFYLTNGGGVVQIGNGAVHNENPAASFAPDLITMHRDVTVEGRITEASSIRFKENVVDLEPVSEKVEALRPVRYNKIDSEKEEIGLIAEEVAELFPEVVEYNDNGETQGINYTRLSVILLKSVQELTERINKLEQSR